MKTIFHLLSFNLLLLFGLDWIVWGEFIPQAGSRGLMEFVGLFLVLSGINILLEFIPKSLKTRR